MQRTVILAAMTVALVGATSAWADDDHDHADAVVWDGVATEDCSVADPGTIVWELTESDDVGYAELHIDEPEASVTPIDGPPHVWVSDLYPLDEIEADVDHIHGEVGAGARLLATYCPDGTLPHTGAALPLLLGAGVGLLGAGVATRRARVRR